MECTKSGLQSGQNGQIEITMTASNTPGFMFVQFHPKIFQKRNFLGKSILSMSVCPMQRPV